MVSIQWGEKRSVTFFWEQRSEGNPYFYQPYSQRRRTSLRSGGDPKARKNCRGRETQSAASRDVAQVEVELTQIDEELVQSLKSIEGVELHRAESRWLATVPGNQSSQAPGKSTLGWRTYRCSAPSPTNLRKTLRTRNHKFYKRLIGSPFGEPHLSLPEKAQTGNIRFYSFHFSGVFDAKRSNHSAGSSRWLLGHWAWVPRRPHLHFVDFT